MLSKSSIGYLRSLGEKKYRQKYGVFVAEGEKLAAEMLLDPHLDIEGIYATEAWMAENRPLLKRWGNALPPASPADMEKISQLKSPPPVVIVAKIPEYDLDLAQLQNSHSLFLDEMQDPGNLGAILRVADWFGIGQVFLSPGCVEVWNPKVVQASMGAVLRVRTFEKSLEEAAVLCSPIFGAVMDGKSVFETDFGKNGLLVIGNESRGIAPENLKWLTNRVTIPRGPGGGAESLNAAVAAGIICSRLLF